MSADPPAGRRRLFKPETLYLVLSGGYTLLFGIVASVNLIFQTEQANLNPFQLVLVGTAYEATRFAMEVPTGIVADLRSRRLSVLIGLVLLGGGMTLGGAFARFETILVAQVIWGTGYTFISGAKEAWIADELGAEGSPGRVFMRGAGVETIARLVSIPIGTAIGLISLQLPILIGGALFFPLAIFLALTMSEDGFAPTHRATRSGMRSMGAQSFAGWRTVRQNPLIVTIFAIAAIYGLAAGSFDRLWVAQFSDNIGLPTMWHLDPVVWFGVLRAGGALLGLAAGLVVRKRLDADDHHTVSRGLFWCYYLQMLSIFVIAITTNFVVGLLAFWLITGITRFYIPLNLAWINQNIDSPVRATVLSMSSQSDSIGRIAGAPWLGALGLFAGLREALAAASIVMLPGLLLFRRSFGQGPPPLPEDEAPSVRLHRPGNEPRVHRRPRDGGSK